MNLTRRSIFSLFAGAAVAPVVVKEALAAQVAEAESVMPPIEHWVPPFEIITPNSIQTAADRFMSHEVDARLRYTDHYAALKAVTNMRIEANKAGKVLMLWVSERHPWGRERLSMSPVNAALHSIPFAVLAQCYEAVISHDNSMGYYVTVVKSKRATNVRGKKIAMYDYYQLEHYSQRLRDAV
ncbi:hypothetical protein EVB87_103 [Rhizobium phage RHph_N28_1]|nr:hypothetical protein EVB87_103 [Rhizobium phage RHph_N28_1]QIG74131.1 hypothetical protein EVC07_103 [Rhizobium phage RHph_N42]